MSEKIWNMTKIPGTNWNRKWTDTKINENEEHDVSGYEDEYNVNFNKEDNVMIGYKKEPRHIRDENKIE